MGAMEWTAVDAGVVMTRVYVASVVFAAHVYLLLSHERFFFRFSSRQTAWNGAVDVEWPRVKSE